MQDDGVVLRDFVCVHDLTRILSYCIRNKISGLFNVATGKSRSIKNYAQSIAYLMQHQVEILSLESNKVNRNYDLVFDQTTFFEKFNDFEFTEFSKTLMEYF